MYENSFELKKISTLHEITFELLSWAIKVSIEAPSQARTSEGGAWQREETGDDAHDRSLYDLAAGVWEGGRESSKDSRQMSYVTVGD